MHYLSTPTIILDFWDSSGYSSKRFCVSLGAPGWPKSQNGHNTGTATQQKGTLMHEFGHTLGIGHGEDHTNYKPNYLSVMNYHFQFPTSVSDRPLDYSECD